MAPQGRRIRGSAVIEDLGLVLVGAAALGLLFGA
jgi:hypothetical protein